MSSFPRTPAAEALKAAEDAFPAGTDVYTIDPSWGPVRGRVVEGEPIVVDTPGHRNEGRVKVLVCWTAAAHTYTKWAFTDTLDRI